MTAAESLAHALLNSTLVKLSICRTTTSGGSYQGGRVFD